MDSWKSLRERWRLVPEALKPRSYRTKCVTCGEVSADEATSAMSELWALHHFEHNPGHAGYHHVTAYYTTAQKC
ncbi:hypothetical protein [Streptomyces luteosporeus]|uniref:DUF7848 domain-containing protein n=1 Tax=Streptomyces luteosporeus TaxID=173856 RepID=A0ABN3U5F2_9ACTN